MHISKKVCEQFKKCEFESDDWIVVGCKINNLDCNSEGYNFWIGYSKTDTENFDIEVCNKYWNIFNKINSFGVATSSLETNLNPIYSTPPPLPDGW